MSMTIREILGDNRPLHSVDAGQTIRFVIDYLYDNKISAVVISNGDQVVGVFSENDLLRRVVHQNLSVDTTIVRDVMTSLIYWISPNERYEVAKAIMIENRLRHLIVMDKNSHFYGFISSHELLEADLMASRDLVGKLNDDYYRHHFKPQSPAKKT